MRFRSNYLPHSTSPAPLERPPILGVPAPIIAALRMLIFFSFFTLSVFFAAIFLGDVFFTGLIDTGS